jgi:hypothetical protein
MLLFLNTRTKIKKAKHVTKLWSWKDWVILLQFVVIVVLLYHVM